MNYRDKPTMTSTEAAALIASEGATTDVETANMMVAGQALDPDKLQRAFFRRALGFDFTIQEDKDTNKWVVHDDELGIEVRTPMAEDSDTDALHLANACMKLKRLHDKQLARDDTPEADVV